MDDKYTDARSQRLPLTVRNRDFTTGADAVKGKTTKYLPQLASQTDDEYRGHLLRTHLFAGAARMVEVLVGQVFRKDYTIEASDAFIAKTDEITIDGKSLSTLSKLAFRDTWITNDSLILVDYPAVPDGMNEADAERLGYQAYLSFYPSESIFEVKEERVGGRQQITYARMRDKDGQVRELKLERQGDAYVYTVSLYKLIEGNWILQSYDAPRMQKAYLDFIPIYPVGDVSDSGAPLDNMCEANHTHYITSADIAMATYWAANPIHFVKGLDKDVPLNSSAGSLWRFESPDSDAKILEWTGKGVGSIENQRDRIAADMSLLGMLVEANEKSAVEAAETHQLRHASATGAVASVVHTVSRAIEKALNTKAKWDGDNTPVAFRLSTDFTPAKIDASFATAFSNMLAKHQISRELFHQMMVQGELIDSTVDFETEQLRIEMDRSEVTETPAYLLTGPDGEAADASDDE